MPAPPSVVGLDLPKTIDEDRVGIDITIDGGMPIEQVTSPTHGISSERVDRQRQKITLSEGRIIDFSNSPREFHSQPLSATADNLRRGLSHVDSLRAGGGTEIDAAIQQTLRVAPVESHLRIVVFLTDGHIGNEHTVLRRIF